MLLRNLRGLMTIDPATVRWPERASIDRLGEIGVPALVLVGGRDAPALPGMAELLAARVRGARLVGIEGGSHHPNLDRPDNFNRHPARVPGGIPVAARGGGCPGGPHAEGAERAAEAGSLRAFA